MKPKTIVILSVLLALCLAYVAIKGLTQKPPAVSPEAPVAKPLFLPPVTDVRKLTVAPADLPRLAFALEDGQWRIIEPVAARASELRVNDVIRGVSGISTVRSFTPGENGQATDAMTGLDKPAFVVTLVDASGKSHTVTLGKNVPFASPAQTYIRTEGDPRTYVAEGDLTQVVAPNARDYRDRNVATIPIEQALRLVVEGQQSYELKKADGVWSMLKPAAARADAEKVTTLLDKLRNITAESFVSDNPGNLSVYELEPGKERLVVRLWTQAPPPPPPASASAPATITSRDAQASGAVTTRDNTPTSMGANAAATASAPAIVEHGLALGKQVDNKVYAKLLDQGAVFLLDAALLTDLQPKIADLRDRKLLRFTSDNVEVIDIALPVGDAKLARINDRWRMIQPVFGPAGDAAVNKLLSTMANLQAADFPESQQALGAYGLETPKARITLHMKGKPETIGLMIGSLTKTGEMTFVAPIDAAAVAVVRSLDVTLMLAEGAAYFDPQLLTLNKDNVRSLQLTRHDGAFTVERQAGKWVLLSPEAIDADLDSVETILGYLANMTAARVVAMGKDVPEKYAKADDQIVVKINMAVPAGPSAPTTATGVAANAAATAPTTIATAPVTTTASLPAISTVLHVVKIGANAYAWVEGQSNNPVGEFPSGLYDTLGAELRSRTVWTFQSDDVTAVRIVSPTETVELKKDHTAWTLTGDPYVKIDAAKVISYMVELGNLKAQRFLTTDDSQADNHGLKEPALKVELTTSGGKTLSLAVGKGQENSAVRPAASNSARGVFELPSATVDRLVKTWKDFLKVEEAPTAPPRPDMPSPMPYMPE